MSLVSESACVSNASHSEAPRNSRLGSPSNTVEASANEDVRTSALTERQLLESAPRCLGEHEVDEHDLKGIPYTIANIIHHLCARFAREGSHNVPSPTYGGYGLYQSCKLDGWSGLTYLRGLFQ